MEKILVIDDTKTFVKGISSILESRGYNVLQAYSGEEGILLANNENPDLILCDILMPYIDGFEVLEAVRENDNISTTPFIFITAFSDRNYHRYAMEKGADDFLLKNQIEDRLLLTIRAQIDKKDRIQKRFYSRMKLVSKNISYALPHEFRTALNEINNLGNYLDQMSDRIDKNEIKEIANDILQSNKRLMKITENFLVFARIQEFHDNPEQMKILRTFRTEEPISIINNIAETIADNYNRESDVCVESGNDHIALEISSENFFKIFSELLDNSFKFSGKDDMINVHHWINDEFMFFEINDNGRGMSDLQIKNIGILSQFERDIYEQQGAGLGLTIAKSLVELHGGTFKIISKQGVGTDIVMKLHIANDYEK